jgi:hypothetical protein
MILETVLGTITGFAGTILTSVLNFKQQREKNKHDIELLKAQTDATIKEAEANIRVSEIQVAGDIQRIETQGWLETLKQNSTPAIDAKVIDRLLSGGSVMRFFGITLSFLMGFVEFMKGIMRPGLTLYILVLATVVTFKSIDIINAHGDVLSVDDANLIFANAMDTIWYLAITLVTWWFGDRRTAKFNYRLNDGNLRN